MEKLKKVIACLKELGKKPKMDDFEDRLVIQKTVCLVKLMGFKINYPFSLYIRGPYSPELTEDLYGNKENVESLKTDYQLSTRERNIVAKVSEASNDLDPILLEIMATHAYLSVECKKSRSEAIVELKRLKPFYSEAKIAVGISRAKQLFLPSEKEISKMKAEFAEMEHAIVLDNKY